jgi:hypothetical protein
LDIVIGTLPIVAFIGIWLLIQIVVVPRLGVGT